MELPAIVKKYALFAGILSILCTILSAEQPPPLTTLAAKKFAQEITQQWKTSWARNPTDFTAVRNEILHYFQRIPFDIRSYIAEQLFNMHRDDILKLLLNKPILTFAEEQPFLDFAFNPQGTLLAGTAGATVYFWDTINFQKKPMFNVPEEIFSITWSPDGSLLAIKTIMNRVFLWDSTNFTITNLGTYQPEDIPPDELAPGTTNVVFDPQNEYIFVSIFDVISKAVFIHLATKQKVSISIPRMHDAILSTNGKYLFTLESLEELPDKLLKIYERSAFITQNPNPFKRITIRDQQFISIKPHPIKDNIILLYNNQEAAIPVQFFDIEKEQVIYEIPGYEGAITDYTTNENKTLFAIGYSHGAIRLFDSNTGALLATFIDHKKEIVGLTFDPQGKYLVSTSIDRTIRIWDIETKQKKPVITLTGHAGDRPIEFQPKDAIFGGIFVCGGMEGELRFWLLPYATIFSFEQILFILGLVYAYNNPLFLDKDQLDNFIASIANDPWRNLFLQPQWLDEHIRSIIETLLQESTVIPIPEWFFYEEE